jgi:flagellar biosynthesis/type III secretory pathway protein FliH
MSEPARAENGNGLAVLLSWLQPGDAAEAVREADVVRDVGGEIVAARAEGFAAGTVAGREEALAELAPLVAALRGAEAALQAACEIEVAAVQPVLAGLVRQVCEAVLMAELSGGALVLAPLVDAALAEVKPGEAAVLRAHPDVLAALEGRFEAVLAQGDAAMALDAFAVEGPGFVIGAGLQARLDAILEAGA